MLEFWASSMPAANGNRRRIIILILFIFYLFVFMLQLKACCTAQYFDSTCFVKTFPRFRTTGLFPCLYKDTRTTPLTPRTMPTAWVTESLSRSRTMARTTAITALKELMITTVLTLCIRSAMMNSR